MRVFDVRVAELVHTPEKIEEFIKRLGRSELRHRLALPVLAVPLNADLKPIAHGFAAVTRDVSSRGIALFHMRPVDCLFLAVELTDPQGTKLESAVQVLRCQKTADYFEIAGNFVTKVYCPSTAETAVM